MTAAVFVASAVVINLSPFGTSGSSTEVLVATHLPALGWFVAGCLPMFERWSAAVVIVLPPVFAFA